MNTVELQITQSGKGTIHGLRLRDSKDSRDSQVMVMEVDKVADEVTGMEFVQMTDIKIPIEDLTGVILAISDTYRDYVRSG